MSSKLSIDQLVELLQVELSSDYFEQLFNYFLPFAYKLFRCYKMRCVDYEDVLQEGRIALIEALEAYDWARDSHFTSFYISVYNNRLRHLKRAYHAEKRSGSHLLTHWREDQPLIFEDNDYYSKSVSKANIRLGQQANPAHLYLIKNAKNDYLASLSTMESAVFDLTLAGYNLQEMYESLEYDLEQIRNAYSRCRKKLTRYLNEIN